MLQSRVRRPSANPACSPAAAASQPQPQPRPLLPRRALSSAAAAPQRSNGSSSTATATPAIPPSASPVAAPSQDPKPGLLHNTHSADASSSTQQLQATAECSYSRGLADSHSPSDASAVGAGGAAVGSCAVGGGTDAAPPAVVVAAPQLPLCRRPPVHEDSLQAVLDWRSAMEGRIGQLGNALEEQDGGPDMQGLMRELDWVLDDVIEACRPGPEAPWEATSWRLLQPQVRSAARRQQDTGGWRLRLREPVQQLWGWWERRLQDRVPFQYLISSAHWHTYVLSVGPGVLVPRPETEIFPELVAAALRRRPHLAAAPWADLGTGSGAIAIAAADVLRRSNPAAEVWAVDLSPVAAAYARFNADMCLGPGEAAASTPASTPASATIRSSIRGEDVNVRSSYSSSTGSSSEAGGGGSGNDSGGGGGGGALRHHHWVRVVQGSWFEPLHHLRGRLGGLLSNPPYIPRVQMSGLQAEVGRHEPWGALDGGEGPGLDSLQVLCAEAASMLAPGGLIALETAGGEQADLVATILRAAPEPDSDPAESAAARGAAADVEASIVVGIAAAGAGIGTGAGAGPLDGSRPGAFEDVEVLEDCYGVRRFVRAYRRAGPERGDLRGTMHARGQ